MDDLKRSSRRMGHLQSRAWETVGVEPAGKCGHWDTSYDKHGYCRDQECRRARLIKALHTGQAFRLKDGTLMWLVE